ncbi:putative tetrapyrrole biosynthesis, uroporphyrinogen III synthase [Medicago truncatula]|uniref:Uroporphyrinogen III synthase n=1 Tax=Medicago truncatula TaxID=3880 RepID=A0A072VJH0_MEDTR|nr:uncharacterized protein LOC25483407 [Medicago truncatula]KEH41583.1 uroporphyrinogen III synthase [Medicago truncatula]RHN79117.1 putative tetrapyrrole biosynthesis, uroporphyrinogen III synthase [Medicago truncatula]
MALTTMLNGGGNTIHNPSVAFTTPQNYASRLSHLLTVNAFKPLWCPTLTIQPTPSTFSPYLSPHSLDPFSAIAFTSRTAIQSFHQAISSLSHPPLSVDGPTFTVAALGKDSELLHKEFLSRICAGSDRVKVLVPPVATPSSLASELGDGGGRRVMCPVPLVVGLEEPPVVPSFLQELRDGGWVPVRVEAYETRWSGPRCAEGIVKAVEEEGLDAVVFTSSAEVEGLLKSLDGFGMGFGDLRRKCPGLVVAAHGPVTAAGAERLGVEVDVVSSKFHSFDGIIDVLNVKLATRFRI